MSFIEIQVYLNGINADEVQVELYADGSNRGEQIRLAMSRLRQLVGAENGYAYKAQVPASRPSGDYTVRIIPHFHGATIPLEARQILWQRLSRQTMIRCGWRHWLADGSSTRGFWITAAQAREIMGTNEKST